MKMFTLLLLVASWCHLTVASVAEAFVHSPDGGEAIVPGVRSVVGPSSRSRVTRDGSIVFPGSPGWPTPGAAPQPHHPTPDLPQDLDQMDQQSLSRLNSISNISEFMSLFDLTLTEEESDGFLNLSVRIGGTSDTPDEAVMANCKPELQTVALDLPLEENTIYFPTCVRLERCGGCCYGPLLTCRATATKAVKLRVLKTVTGGSGNSRRRGNRRRRRQSPASYHYVEEVRHTACGCGCRVREEDCNSAVHNYFEGECSCVCKNKDEKRKCEEQNSTKYWDNDSCNCYCLKPQDCSSGEFFSHASCRCETVASRSAVAFGVSTDEGGPTRTPGEGPRRPGPVRPSRRRPLRVTLA